MKRPVLVLLLLFPFLIFAEGSNTSTAKVNVIFKQPSAKKAGLTASNTGVYWGAFLGGEPLPLSIKQFEDNTGKKMSQIMWFLDWNSDFPVAHCTVLYKSGYIPHITWEPWLWSDKEAINLDKIIAGQFDTYINTFAKGAKAYGSALFLRVGHEFNGNWYPWAVSKNNNDPEKYKKAYIHIHDIFTAAGADNVQWIWAPNCSSVPDSAWNDPLLAYPGDAYVDWIGMDGYNFGSTQSWSKWVSLSEIFGGMYEKLSSAITGKPFMLAEFACADKGGDKSEWTGQLETELKEFPRIRSVVWFDLNKEADWRVDSSPEVLGSFRKTLSSKFFLVSQKGLESAAKNTITLSAAIKDPVDKATGPKKSIRDNKKPFMLVKTVQDAVIDGVFNEKIKTEPILIGQNSKGVSGKLYMGYDSTNIYIFADISDKTPGINLKKGADIWDGDALELALCTNPDADPARTSYDNYDFQIGIKAAKDTETWNFTKKAPLINPIIFYNEKKGGYTIEAFIPWSNFNTGCFCRIKNKIISFDAAIDNADDKSGRNLQVRWTGNEDYYKNPSQWGQVMFSTEK
jgi:hypothetical protein